MAENYPVIGAVNVTSTEVKCPGCGATIGIKYDPNTLNLLCPFCGSKQYFSDAKLQQAQARDSVRDEIRALVESEALDESGKEKLMKLLTALDSRQKRQNDCETLLKAKLGGECVVVLGDETAEVVVEPGTVNETTSLQIAEILAKHAQVTSDNLTIIEAKETAPAEDVKK